MYLMNLMNKKCMTRADLSMMSGVPDSTLRDILSGKAQIDHCEAATIYGIADALGIDDGSEFVTWLYAQTKRFPREYG